MPSKNGLSHSLIYTCTLLGSAIGTCGFFGLAFLTWPNPVSNTLRASIATLGREPDQVVKIAQVQKVAELIQSGYVLTTNDLLSNMASYYGTLVTVLLGLIGLIAAGAYLTIRGNSMVHVEEVLDRQIEHRSDTYFESTKFQDLLVSRITTINQLDKEDRGAELEGLRKKVDDLESRYALVDQVLSKAAAAASPEEPSEGEPAPAAKPARASRAATTKTPRGPIK